ncbi:MAG: hypothetical protein A2V70_06510 [Planctomycetes bacterium RBG_13_63_9]|nr:MAG: hypothetical protein A2V70_06510 [Planctomycetes bacterium RBG_13_63_9]
MTFGFELSTWWECYRASPPLISPRDTWLLWSVILVGVAASIYLEQTRKWAAKVSGPVLAMLAAMVLSNLRVMPTQSDAYAMVNNYLVPLAIPLLLLRANVVRIIRTTGSMFAAFNIAALGTIAGAFTAAAIFSGRVDQVPQIAGIMTGSYTGGAVNFFAIKESFKVSENLTNPLLVADTVIMAGMFAVCLLISNMRFFHRRYPHPHSLEADTEDNQLLAAKHWKAKQISLLDIATVLAIAIVIAAVSDVVAAMVRDQQSWPSLVRALLGNQYVLITFISVAVATLFHEQMERIGGCEELGAYLLYVFFFVIGLPADLYSVVRNVPLLFAFCVVMALVNLVVTLVAGKLLRMNLEELLVCVNATLGGPPSAAAMAIAKGWPKLVLPALLVGIWGYAIGTFLGVLVGQTLMRLF